MWLRKNGSNDQADIQQELKATTTNMIKKKASNEQAFSQEGHTARIEWLRKMYPMRRLASNKNMRPQQPIWLSKRCIQWPGFHPTGTQGHNDQVIMKKWIQRPGGHPTRAGIQQEHKATTTTVIKKKIIQWPGFHPTGTQGHNDQVIMKKWIQWPGGHPTRAGIQQEHEATTNNVIQKNMNPMSWLATTRNTRPQQPMGLRKNASNDNAHTQHTATNAIKNKCIQWSGKHPTRTQGHNNHNDWAIKKNVSNE